MSTGNYTRLPKIIEKTFIPPAPLSKEEIAKIVRTLESNIRVRVLVDEVVPNAMRRGMRIENGCVHFRVENEFEVALTLDGVGKEAKWKLLELKILVRGASVGYESVPRGLNGAQLQGMGEAAQKRLSGRKNSPSAVAAGSNVNATPEPGESKPAEKHWPLVELWECLHPFCLRMQLEVLKVQAEHLARIRWKDRLGVEFREGEGMLRLEFWKDESSGFGRRSAAGIARSSPQSRILEFAIKSEIPPADINWMKHTNPAADLVPPSGVKNDLSIHPAVAKSLTVGSEGRVKRWMQVRILKKGGGMGGEALEEVELLDDGGQKVDLGFKGVELDVEKILFKVVEGLAREVILKIRDSLLPPPTKTSQSPGEPAKLKRKHDVAFQGALQIRVSSASGPAYQRNPASSSFASRYYAPHQLSLVDGLPSADSDIVPAPQLDVDFMPGKKLRIWIDVRTGRTRLSEGWTITGGKEKEKRLREVEEKVWNYGGVDGVREGLTWVAGEMMIDAVEKIAGEVGLVGLRKVGVAEKDLLKLSDPLPAHKIFLRFRGFADTYIVVGVGFRPGNELEAGMELQWRVWVMTTRSTGYEGEYVIETATPLKVGDVLGGRSTDVGGDGGGVIDTDTRGGKRRRGAGGVSIQVEKEVVSEVSEAVYWWDKLDTESLIGVESACRKQIAYTKIAAELMRLKVPFSYLFAGSSEPGSPTQADLNAEKLFRLAPRILIHKTYFIKSQVELCPFSDMILEVEGIDSASAGDGDDNGGLLGLGVGDVKGVRVLARVLVRREGTARVEWTGGRSVEFDDESGALIMSDEEVEGCCERILQGWWKGVGVLWAGMEAAMHEEILQKLNAHAVIRDLEVLQISLDGGAIVEISWEGGAGAGLGEGKYRVEFKIQQQDQGWRRWLEIMKGLEVWAEGWINGRGEGGLVGFVMILTQTSPLLRHLIKMEHFRNSNPLNRINPAHRLVTIIPRNMTCFRVIYGELYAVDFVLARHGVLAVIDGSGCSFDGGVNLTGGVPNVPAAGEGLRSGVQRLHLQPIPRFSTSFGGGMEIGRGEGLVEGVIDFVERWDEQVAEGEELAALPMSHGVLVDIRLCEGVVGVVDRHMDAVCVVGWVEGVAKGMKGVAKVVRDDGAMQCTMEMRGLLVTVLGRGRSVRIQLAPRVDPMSVDPLKIDATQAGDLEFVLNHKLANLPPQTDVRPLLRMILRILALPNVPLRDLCLLANAERRPPGAVATEWCLCVPPGAPGYVGAEGGVAMSLEGSRMGLVIKFSRVDNTTPQTLYVALRYNWDSKVINLWRSEPDDDDFTSADSNHFLMNKLSEIASSPPVGGGVAGVLRMVLAKASVTTLDIHHGGPGKLGPFIKHVVVGQARIFEGGGGDGSGKGGVWSG